MIIDMDLLKIAFQHKLIGAPLHIRYDDGMYFLAVDVNGASIQTCVTVELISLLPRGERSISS